MQLNQNTHEDLSCANVLMTLAGQPQSCMNNNKKFKTHKKKKYREPDSKVAKRLGISRQTAWRRRMKAQALS